MISKLCTDDGRTLYTQEAMEKEVLNFYGNLMGKADMMLEWVDIEALRRVKLLTREKRSMLSAPVSDKEVENALKSIGELKATRIDRIG